MYFFWFLSKKKPRIIAGQYFSGADDL